MGIRWLLEIRSLTIIGVVKHLLVDGIPTIIERKTWCSCDAWETIASSKIDLLNALSSTGSIP